PEDLRRGTAVALEAADVAAALPRRSAAGHKRDAGIVLVVAGSIPMPGAAALVAGASVRSGAGLTILAAPEPVCRIALARVPEIVTIPLGGAGEGTIDDKALEQIRPRLGEADVLAIGPGLTTHAAAAGAIRSLIAEAACPVVADADAITALAAEPAVVTSRTVPTLLTPHAGELARRAGSAAATLDADRLTAVRDAAGRLAATILFKGPGTVVAGDGETYVTVPGGRALAQGGTGDVLTGLAASLIAQAGAGASVPLLAAVAAWLHSAAGDALGERRAPLPASPSLLIDEIAATIHEVAA
ncbi:MAG: NAD(P)H-hydrate dehydratase, partial [Vicinamibacteria bacterium]